jgi:hypothetical protein
MRMVEFRKLVDAAIAEKCGLSTYDLPDFDLYNYWDEHMQEDEAQAAAADAALDLLDEEGFPFEEDER